MNGIPHKISARASTSPPPHGEGRVLVVDDDLDALGLIEKGLTHLGFEIVTATSAERALELLDHDFEAVLTDVKLGAMDGVTLCRRIQQGDHPLPVVLVTAFGDMELAIAAMRAGAHDFVTKPFALNQIVLALTRVVRDHRLHQRVEHLSERLALASQTHSLIGDSPPMRELERLIALVATTQVTVLITGETGTGKELVARALHDRSGRRGEFVAINCAAIPASLLESELFGHVKGAFTDARSTRKGLIAQAGGGTLFLDEIGEMALETQVKLLRVIQERKVRPVGGNVELDFDARIIAATNRDLSVAVRKGEFREDLLYRINVVPLVLAPLRERGDDILLLAQAFLERASARSRKTVTGFSDPAAARLTAYDWPGNVRELENTIERAVAFTRYTVLMAEDLPQRIRLRPSADILLPWSQHEDNLPSLLEVEARYVRRVLAAVDNDRAGAAQLLGIDRRTLQRYLQRPCTEDGETSLAAASLARAEAATNAATGREQGV